MTNGLERCLLLRFGCSHQLSQNKFYDPSTPSMRKGGEKKRFLVAPNVFASRLAECRPSGTPTARAKN